MKPSVSTRKRTPSSFALTSPASRIEGSVEPSHAVHGQAGGPAGVTVTLIEGPEPWRFPQSSTARARTVTAPVVCGDHANDQLVVPVAGAHVAPPSTDTSTPRTLPPPTSAALPVIVVVAPAGTEPPSSGKPIDDVGALASPDAAAATSPDWSEPACAPISASRFTVACCIASTGASLPRSCTASSPHDHCTVPAPKTSAPLGAR